MLPRLLASLLLAPVACLQPSIVSRRSLIASVGAGLLVRPPNAFADADVKSIVKRAKDDRLATSAGKRLHFERSCAAAFARHR